MGEKVNKFKKELELIGFKHAKQQGNESKSDISMLYYLEYSSNAIMCYYDGINERWHIEHCGKTYLDDVSTISDVVKVIAIIAMLAGKEDLRVNLENVLSTRYL